MSIQEPINPQSHWLTALPADRFHAVEQRVLRQLLQALIFEDILSFEFRAEANSERGCFILNGNTEHGQTVQYHCQGSTKHSFAQIKLANADILRVTADGATRPASLQDVLAELIAPLSDSAYLSNFIEELEQTLLKDAQAHHQVHIQAKTNAQPEYDELEGDIIDAHSYHPCYKSRIGFSLADNQQYAPEFKNDLNLHWLAVRREQMLINCTHEADYQAFIAAQLGEADCQHFNNVLQQQGCHPEDYYWLPVHPWQWQAKSVHVFYPELRQQDMVYLGQGSDCYRAQQSIRTLANRSHAEKPYAKLSLSITNTSTSRILAGHTVMNAAIITDWLHGLLAQDSVAQALDFVILGETVGASFNYQTLPAHRTAKAYGTLGVIWRESVHQYLCPDESAAPFNGLCSVLEQLDHAQPLIEPWLQRYGVEAWTQQLLTVAISPIIHMLFAHGIGMESHAQNIILIHRDGWPVRIALKDFHDGVRYSPSHLAHPERAPQLCPVPESHARINRNSFILTDDLNAVRDFSCDAFFFICLADLAIFLNERYQLPEATFWTMAATIITDYQARYPEHAARYQAFDVFTPQFEIEALTQRRLFGDSEVRSKVVENPLHRFKPC